MSRGLRNNNPGNIRISATKYQGEIQPSQDRAFKQFQTMAHGYRAMFMLLYTYRKKHGCDTIRKMITRYAPPVENHTNVYIDSVARWSGINPDVQLDTTSREVMVPVISAMSRMENGKHAAANDVEAGWGLFIASI
ncbi:structural protein P5 [Parabacteroides sp. PF5-9]|uniref:structural protein P5 n=1 Tax=Parabacteroides sp. PF5-9 TaxID=1742404 RepID=UPI0024772922|nr:structural protein P5 [Parabacteroides sp. PF5-9]MDH6357239.1 hypothetical protein [Parabacteroides sp. PF5-9]